MSACIWVSVVLPSRVLADHHVLVTLAGHLGQVGDHHHLGGLAELAQQAAHHGCAVGPLIPTSTSSKIRVGVEILRALITTRARLMRDSSPPEATLPSGWMGCPGWW